MTQRSNKGTAEPARAAHRTDDERRSFTRRLVLLLVVFPLFALSVVYGVLGASAAPPAPTDVVPGPPLGPRLAERVLLVIVDGLRYDVATDPKRMPLFANAMRTRSHGEIWAGPVSMTSSAVMAIGTGQRGRLEQVIRNLHAEPARQNSWIANARAAGLRMMTVGDPAWPQFYSQWLERYTTDPEGVAIDVDFNPITFENVRKLRQDRPDFLVAHFVTPDHQGHAYRVTSDRYARHIRDFDQKLTALLAEFDSTWTVIVTSDHGAADSGTHGSDADIQRRSPIYAYGRGIVQNVPLTRRIDQLELSVTLAVLLGVAPPAHGTGRAIDEWLDVPEVKRADMACENAQRVLTYAEHTGARAGAFRDGLQPCLSAASSAERLQSALRTVETVDKSVTDTVGLGSPTSNLWLALILSLGGLAMFTLAPRIGWRMLLLDVALVLVTVVLVAGVEKLPGVWPNVVRAILFVLGNAILLALLVSPKHILGAFERYYPLSTLLPAALAVSYPADTRPQVVVVTAVVGLTYALLARRFSEQSPNRNNWFGTTFAERWWFITAVVALVPVALHENGTYSSLVDGDAARRIAASLFAGLFALWLWPKLGVSWRVLVLLVVLAVLPIWLRPVVGPLVGRGAWFLGFLAFAWALAHHRPAWAVAGGVYGLLWVAREIETVPLIATVSAAWIFGTRLAERPKPEISRADLIMTLLFGFSLMFALRMGLQDGLEFGGMDWGAAAFNDPSISAFVVGTALVYKYAMGALLVAYALGARLLHDSERRILIGLSLCMLLRSVALAAMFFVAGNSYWTALRVLGDLPTAVSMALGCVMLLAVRTLVLRRSREGTRRATASACPAAAVAAPEDAAG